MIVVEDWYSDFNLALNRIAKMNNVSVSINVIFIIIDKSNKIRNILENFIDANNVSPAWPGHY